MNSINIISILTPVTVNSLFEIAACVSDIRKHPIEEVKQRFIPCVYHETVIDQTKIITKVNYSKDRKTIEKITFITYEVES